MNNVLKKARLFFLLLAVLSSALYAYGKPPLLAKTYEGVLLSVVCDFDASSHRSNFEVNLAKSPALSFTLPKNECTENYPALNGQVANLAFAGSYLLQMKVGEENLVPLSERGMKYNFLVFMVVTFPLLVVSFSLHRRVETGKWGRLKA